MSYDPSTIKLMLDELIDESIPLEEINTGFDNMETGSVVRSVIEMKH